MGYLMLSLSKHEVGTPYAVGPSPATVVRCRTRGCSVMA